MEDDDFSGFDDSFASVTSPEQRDEGAGHVLEPIRDGFFVLQLALCNTLHQELRQNQRAVAGSDTQTLSLCVSTCLCECTCVCLCLCVCERARLQVHVCVCAFFCVLNTIIVVLQRSSDTLHQTSSRSHFNQLTIVLTFVTHFFNPLQQFCHTFGKTLGVSDDHDTEDSQLLVDDERLSAAF